MPMFELHVGKEGHVIPRPALICRDSLEKSVFGSQLGRLDPVRPYMDHHIPRGTDIVPDRVSYIHLQYEAPPNSAQYP
jgi:hypothetical protein